MRIGDWSSDVCSADLAPAHAGEGDQVAARRPFGGRGAATAKADPLLVRSVDIHHIDLLAARPVALEHDLAPVGRETAADVDARRGRQAYRRPAVRRDSIDSGVDRKSVV